VLRKTVILSPGRVGSSYEVLSCGDHPSPHPVPQDLGRAYLHRQCIFDGPRSTTFQPQCNAAVITRLTVNPSAGKLLPPALHSADAPFPCWVALVGTPSFLSRWRGFPASHGPGKKESSPAAPR
jgi:hypothetical protein